MTPRAVLHVVFVVLAIAGCDRVFQLTTPIDAAPDADIDAPPPPPASWRMVDAGAAHACGLHYDKSLWCWGRNDSGQLGIGMLARDVERTEPVQVGTALWSSVSTSADTTCGIQEDGSLWCWGRNAVGQLGDGSMANRFEPVRIGDAQATWKAVVAGWDHSCALDSLDVMWCWGAGADGQRGDGSMGRSLVPTRVSGVTSWKTLGLGIRHTCAIATDDSLWCWGLNDHGRLGLGDNSPQFQYVPARVGTETWRSLGVGGEFACAVTIGGAVRCWGANQYGQLGEGSTSNRTAPTVAGQDEFTDYTEVMAGEGHVCGLRAEGELRCWGRNHRGQLGLDLTVTSRPTPTLIAVDGIASPWAKLGLGQRTSCAIDAAGQLWCVGNASHGALGTGEGSRRTPVMIPGSWAEVSLGDDATCARSGQSLTCWGANYDGLLGDATLIDKQTPPAPMPMPWAAFDLGDHGCAIAPTTSQLWCWGRNDSYQLGTGATNMWTTMPVVVGVATWTRISSSRSHNCGISAGSLYCWGRNGERQTGQTRPAPNENGPISVPTLVTSALLWLDVGTGIDFTCGLKSDNKAYCWGHSGSGQLGNAGATGQTPTPQLVTTAQTFNRIVVGGRHVCGLTTAGAASCWGWNLYGQLGLGSVMDRNVPVPLTGTWKSLSLGEEHSCGVRTDNTLWCWGRNHYAQVGDGTTIDRIDPTQVGTATDWAAAAAGRRHSCATKTSGELWCWGGNEGGPIGDGTAWRSTFTLVTK